MPVAARAVDLWLPAPRSDSHQQISDLQVTAPAPYRMRRDAQNNLVLYLRVAGTPPEVRVVMTFRVRREEHRQERLAQRPAGDVAPAPPLAAYLRPDRLGRSMPQFARGRETWSSAFTPGPTWSRRARSTTMSSRPSSMIRPAWGGAEAISTMRVSSGAGTVPIFMPSSLDTAGRWAFRLASP